jgi:hypothetical protein
MTIGTSLFLIAAGAILRYAVEATVAGVDIQAAGLILIIIGAIGLAIGLFMLASERRREDKVVYEERRDPTYR